jgi:hypothetical protein
MLRHLALIRTDILEEFSASIIRVTRIDDLGTTLTVNSNRRLLKIEALCSSETLVLARGTRRNIPEEAILHSHRRDNLRSYKAILVYI